MSSGFQGYGRIEVRISIVLLGVVAALSVPKAAAGRPVWRFVAVFSVVALVLLVLGLAAFSVVRWVRERRGGATPRSEPPPASGPSRPSGGPPESR